MAYDRLPKVELHNHFDGACKVETLRDMCRKDALDKQRFPYDDLEKFRGVVSLLGPQKSLVDFLEPFKHVCFILSTKENLQRQAREFCREQKRQNVIYSESRICPHLFLERGLTPSEVLNAVLEGFKQGEEETGVLVRVILCFLKTNPEWSTEIADLAIHYKDQRVVGVDIAGDELAPMDERHLDAFKRVWEAGLHITVHAGESGPAKNVRHAIEVLHAKRIGHGYKTVADRDVYNLAKSRQTHFEVCLTSSIFTSSAEYEDHTVKEFVKDGVNFGLNTDDPGIIGHDLNYEFNSASTHHQLRLTEDQLIQTVYNSARSCFLPEDEKKALLEQLDKKVEEYRQSS